MEAVQKCMALCQRDGTVEYCIRYYLRQYSTDDPVPYPEPEDAAQLLCALLVLIVRNDMCYPLQLPDPASDQFQADGTQDEEGRQQCHAYRRGCSGKCYLKRN